MANVDVSGFAQFSDGTSVPLFNDAMPEGTLTSLQTNATFTVAAQDLGNSSHGKTLLSRDAYSENNGAYVFVLRQGLPIFCGTAAKSGVMAYGNKM